jgi:hypothetical protein
MEPDGHVDPTPRRGGRRRLIAVTVAMIALGSLGIGATALGSGDEAAAPSQKAAPAVERTASGVPIVRDGDECGAGKAHSRSTSASNY